MTRFPLPFAPPSSASIRAFSLKPAWTLHRNDSEKPIEVESPRTVNEPDAVSEMERKVPWLRIGGRWETRSSFVEREKKRRMRPDQFATEEGMTIDVWTYVVSRASRFDSRICGVKLSSWPRLSELADTCVRRTGAQKAVH